MELDFSKNSIPVADLTKAFENLVEATPEGLAIRRIKVVPGLRGGNDGGQKGRVEWHLLVAFGPERTSPNGPEDEGSPTWQMGIFRVDQHIQGGTFLPKNMGQQWVSSTFGYIRTREGFFAACYGLAEK